VVLLTVDLLIKAKKSPRKIWRDSLFKKCSRVSGMTLQVSKALHAAEGQEKQARQHAGSLKAAAYAAQALAGKDVHVS
jgi:hypothetical protein